MTRYRPQSCETERGSMERADAYERCAEANDEMRLHELITRPGDTIGLAVGVPLPEGFHLGNTTTEQCTDTTPKKNASLSMSPS